MAQKVYEFQKGSHTFDCIIPSGYTSLTGFTSMELKIVKPDGTIATKALTSTNIHTDSKSIKFVPEDGLFNQEGIYDYQVINKTSSGNEIGKILQFTIKNNSY